MSLPTVTGKRLLKSLIRNGYIKVRQKGSHVTVRDPNDPSLIAVVVFTSDDLLPGTLYSIKRGLNLSREEFLEILNDC
jgi:predicted RNA binding protein YcfA (HicA-like mRNA interferase family)